MLLEYIQDNAKNHLALIVDSCKKEGHDMSEKNIDNMLLEFNTIFIHENYRFINLVDVLFTLNEGSKNEIKD